MWNMTEISADVETGPVELGPIDYLLVEFPADHNPDGSALIHLVDLVDRGVISVLDLAVIRREGDGVAALEISDIDVGADLDADILAEASSGLLDDQDLADAASALADGCLGVLVVYENVWAAPFATDLRRAGAQLVASGRIPVNAILEALGTAD